MTNVSACGDCCASECNHYGQLDSSCDLVLQDEIANDDDDFDHLFKSLFRV